VMVWFEIPVGIWIAGREWSFAVSGFCDASMAPIAGMASKGLPAWLTTWNEAVRRRGAISVESLSFWMTS
ncbi:hypothetical protein, partial [Pseudomonas sp. Kh7]|uniref:hypothetical protein n=1 Tax=Pseudomonas sp. Kh7 TaxID=2093743 RepID=UPI001C498CE1